MAAPYVDQTKLVINLLRFSDCCCVSMCCRATEGFLSRVFSGDSNWVLLWVNLTP